jgi:16S rRNA (cytidine1402-2'-O)-methyltransferase
MSGRQPNSHTHPQATGKQPAPEEVAESDALGSLSESSLPPGLYVVATPIGNLDDISRRALHVLSHADALACEDTRITRKIYTRYGLPSPRTFFSCHEHNEAQVVPRITGLIRSGKSVALCSDGGYPGISDPGYRVMRACYTEGLPVFALPGPSAVHTALVLSGLPTSSYTFKGFPPRKAGARRRFLEVDKGSPHTLVFFESPYRLLTFLEDALAVLGNRSTAVCFELTKKHERVERGRLRDLLEILRKQVIRGEITVVIEGGVGREEEQGKT